MKKIAMAVAAVAMATTMFAADVSVIVNGYGDFFNMKFEDGAKPQVLGWNDPWDRQYSWSSTGLGFNFSGDKAGASFELDGNNKADDVNRLINVKNSKVWVQPVDMLKITLGANSIGLAKETIDYDGTVANVDFEGWQFACTPVDGLTVDLGLVTNQPTGWSTNYWYGGKNYGAASMGEIVSAVTYGADFGTIKAFYDYNDKVNKIGLDFAGNFGGVAVSPAVAYTTAKDVSKVAADLYVQASVDSIGINVYTKYDGDLKAKENGNALQVKGKVTFGTSIGSAYLYANCANVMAEKFDMSVKAGLNYNIGAAGMETALQFDVAAKTLSVPFNYKVSF